MIEGFDTAGQVVAFPIDDRWIEDMQIAMRGATWVPAEKYGVAIPREPAEAGMMVLNGKVVMRAFHTSRAR